MSDKYYVVTSMHGRNYYTDHFADALEVYSKKTQEEKYVEILFGEPGHFGTVRQSW